jgi:RNA polymerase sigma factor (sigma-70 family)
MTQRNGLIESLRGAALRQHGPALTDADLLEVFVARREEAAFEALLRRHGPMVWGVCRRVLQNEADAEDAFQATFLVLVRKAASIVPRARVGNWLYGVAHNTAIKAQALNRKRRAKEREAAARPRPEAGADDWQQTQALLDQELSRLPDKYRALIVLCDLEGKSRKEAARHFGVPEGTVAGRLARARTLLAGRLARRGVTLSAAGLALFLSRAAVAEGMPGPLVVSSIKAASLSAAGSAATAGVVSARAAALTEGVIQAMFLVKIKIVTAVLLAAAFLGGASVLLLSRTHAQGPGAGQQAKDQPKQKAPGDAPRDKDKGNKEGPAADEELTKALNELKKTYALPDGEDVKCVKPPFPASRREWFRIANMRRIMVKGTDAPPTSMIFRWNKGDLQHWSASFGTEGPEVASLLTSIAGIYPPETEGDAVLLKDTIEADFVVREGAPAEKVVAGLEKVLRKEFQAPVKMEFREVERRVYVAAGKYRFVPVKGRPADRIELYARDLGDPKLGGGGSGNFDELLQWTGRFIGKRIVAGKIEDAPKDRVSWHDNTPSGPFTIEQWEEAHEAEPVLKHLADQTGLTFKEEKRRVRVLFVERKE